MTFLTLIPRGLLVMMTVMSILGSADNVHTILGAILFIAACFFLYALTVKPKED